MAILARKALFLEVMLECLTIQRAKCDFQVSIWDPQRLLALFTVLGDSAHSENSSSCILTWSKSTTLVFLPQMIFCTAKAVRVRRPDEQMRGLFHRRFFIPYWRLLYIRSIVPLIKSSGIIPPRPFTFTVRGTEVQTLPLNISKRWQYRCTVPLRVSGGWLSNEHELTMCARLLTQRSSLNSSPKHIDYFKVFFQLAHSRKWSFTHFARLPLTQS